MNRRLLFILIFLISLLPSLYLAYLHTVDPFLYSPLADTAYAQDSGMLTDINKNTPAYVVVIYTISSICNIPPLQLAYLPIGAIIFPFCIYALAKRILPSKIIPILLLLYFAFDFSLYPGNFSLLAYAWAHPLFFVFVLLFIMYSQSERRNPSLIALIIVIFTAITFLHPTYVFWAISFAISLNVVLAITKFFKFREVKLTSTPYLTLSLFVIYFGFNQLYFGFYLSRVIIIEPEVISEQFVSMVRTFLGLAAPLSAPYQNFIPAPTVVIGYAAFSRTSLLVLCLMLGIINWLRKYYHKFSIKFDGMITITVALLIAGMLHTIGYALYGHISMRFMIMFFPIIAVFLMGKTNLKKSINVLVTLVIVLAFAQTASYIAVAPPVNNIDAVTEPYSDWLISHASGEVVLLSDFDTSQITYFYYREAGENMTQRYYTSDFYAAMVNGTEEINITEYVALNWDMSATYSVGWTTFDPVSEYAVQISENVHLNRIFDDGHISLMRSTYFY
jgi:hypothetical protein